MAKQKRQQRQAQRKDTYERIAERMIEALESGTAPWRRPWRRTGLGVIPANLASGRAYRGVNVWTLSLAGYGSRYWCTFKQAKDLGGHVRRGEKGWPVLFWKFLEKTERDAATGQETTERIPLARSYTVFNAEQLCSGCDTCEGIDHKRLIEEQKQRDKGGDLFEPLAEPQNVTDRYVRHGGPALEHMGDSAYYVPSADRVVLPKPEAFETAAAYHSVAFHELAHSTGHRSRLARDGLVNVARFGDHTYAAEELVAEFTASYLRALTGIEDPGLDDLSAAYLSGWAERIRKDPRQVAHAAAQAQHAADWILGDAIAQRLRSQDSATPAGEAEHDHKEAA